MRKAEPVCQNYGSFCLVYFYGASKNGSEICLTAEGTCQKFIDSVDLVQGLANFLARELTRMEAEKQKRTDEDKYSRLFKTMTLGVVIHDARGRVTEANHAACKILGLSMDQMLGKTAFDPRWRAIKD